MNPVALFAFSTLMTLSAAAMIAALYGWPLLRNMKRDQALIWLIAPHMLLRFIGISFLIPGVVSPSLPAAFAVPAAYGDVAAGILAIIAVYALSIRASWAVPAVVIFNTWGAADLILAFLNGPRVHLQPGALGAAYFIPTVFVPILLITHVLIFLVLVRRARPALS